jgi:hypothetical protein
MKLTKAQSFMLSVADFPYLLENTTHDFMTLIFIWNFHYPF